MKKYFVLLAFVLTVGASYIFADGYETFKIGSVMFRSSDGSIEVYKTSGNFTQGPTTPDRAYIPSTVNIDIRKMMYSALLSAQATGATVSCWVTATTGTNNIRDIQIGPN
jgi:hypothetical protein